MHVSNIQANNTSYGIRATGIPFGRCDSTSTSKVFTATVPGIQELTDGVCAMIENGVVTSESGFTLNVNGLGAKPCYTNLAAATRDTTLFNVAYTMLFVYDEERVEGGCWVCYRGYDANTNTIGYQVRSNSHSLPASQKFYRYRLLFTSADGTHYVPANTSSSTNATSSRTVNQTPIDPFGHIVYYGTTAAVEANARPAATSLWVIYTLSLGYSFNKTGAALTLDDWSPVYLKCAPQSNGSAIIDDSTPYVQSLPTTADGKIYIFLGVAYNATSIELLNSHPVYYHDGTGIRIWTGKTIPSKTSDLTNDSNFVQSTSLAAVATSGSYNDLTNKPTIPAAITVDSTITQNGTNPVQGGAIYSALEGKEDKHIILNLEEDANYNLVFTDLDGNTITHTQVLGWLQNKSASVMIDYDGTMYEMETGGEDYWHGIYHTGDYYAYINLQGADYPITTLEFEDKDENYLASQNWVQSRYVHQNRKINNKPLSTDITLTASDVGALPSNTDVPSITYNSSTTTLTIS